MTIWNPDLSKRTGPKYLAIADALEADIATGALPPGTRLPTHRDLAYALGITVGTVTRAYKEAEKRSLLGGEVGRGTYVRTHRDEREEAYLSHMPYPNKADGVIDLGLNYPHAVDRDRDRVVRESLGRIMARNDLSDFMTYQPEAGTPSHRIAGAKWLCDYGLVDDPDRIIVTNGGQNGMTLLLMEFCKPGDTLLVEELTYPGITLLAERLGVKIHGLEMDDEGLRPGALAAALKAGIGRIAYLMPSLQNPTSRTMSQERRQQIADITVQYKALVIEDDVYGPMSIDRPPALSTYAPDNCFYLTSASKCMAPGLRIGFIHAPKRYVTRVAQAMRANSWMAAPMNAEIISDWIMSGQKDLFIAGHQDNAIARQKIVEQRLGHHPLEMGPESYHAWLHLPHYWKTDDFVEAARDRGVVVMGASAFHVGRSTAPAAIRLAIARTPNLESLDRGCEIIAQLLDEVPASSLPII